MGVGLAREALKAVSILYEVEEPCNDNRAPPTAHIAHVSILYEVEEPCNATPAPSTPALKRFQSSTRSKSLAT